MRLNDVEIRVTKLTRKFSRNVSKNSVPGQALRRIDRLGFTGMDITIEAYAIDESDFDEFMALLVSDDVDYLKFYINDYWYYRVTAEVMDMPDVEDIDAYTPMKIKLSTEEPMRYSENVNTVTDSITSSGDTTTGILTNGTAFSHPTITVTGTDRGALFQMPGPIQTAIDATVYTNSTTSYVLQKTVTLSAIDGQAFNIDYVSGEIQSVYDHSCALKITYQAASLNGGVETTILDQATFGIGYVVKSASPDILCAENEELVIRYYSRSSGAGYQSYAKNLTYIVKQMRINVAEDVAIYNSTDNTVVLDMANMVYVGESVTIDPIGVGEITYSDTFTTNDYIHMMWNQYLATYSSGQVTLASGGFLDFYFDVKYPIRSIPTLTATIDDAGSATIQISEDGETWYDIDDAVVDNVQTEYNLVSLNNLELKGKTGFYVRINEECTVYDVDFSIGIITVYSQLIKIIPNVSNTLVTEFSGEVDSIDLTVEYNDRKWG